MTLLKSDLDLVSDAMSYMSYPASSDPKDSSNPKDSQDPLANIDLNTLTPQDRALLQPMLDLLNQSAGEGLGEDEIAKKLDEAGEVADGLEGMLDRLLDRLGGMLEEDEEEKEEQEVTEVESESEKKEGSS